MSSNQPRADPHPTKKINYQNIEEEQNAQKLQPSEILDEINSHRIGNVVPLLRFAQFIKRYWITLIIGFMLLLMPLGLFANYILADSPYYYQFSTLPSIEELPFCLMVIPSEQYSESNLKSSIEKQNYKNYQTATGSDQQNNYYMYKKKIKQKCKANSIVMFINLPLKQGALKYLNQNMSRFKAWVFYAQNDGRTEIVAFYYRIYELLETNDFDKTNSPYFAYNDRQVQTLSFFELCQDFKQQIPKVSIFQPTGQRGYFYLEHSNSQNYSLRTPYTKILRLSQDYPAQISQFQRAKTKMHFSLLFQPFSVTRLTKQNMWAAIDRHQLIYLPENHPIARIQYLEFARKYSINKYEDISKQVRFCVTVLSRNNIQNNRYLKVLMSIVSQKYDNYHIVFIDDSSTDDTMKKTIEYMKDIKFPQDRIKYVQNLKRNYATYNIINAAFSYCHENDIQMLIDGDDEFIGRYAFQVMNSAYQQNKDIWIAYSNLKNNYYIPGLSRSYTSDQNHIKDGKRLSGSFIGPIRTWRVKLIYNIPIQNHKFSDGSWIDMAYDDSLAHPMVELSRFARTHYIPQIFYEYNTNYGDNDNSNQQKLKRRLDIYNHVLSLPVLDRLDTLENTVKQKNIVAQFARDYGVRYKTLQV